MPITEIEQRKEMSKPSLFKLILHTILSICPLLFILVVYVIFHEAISERLTGGYFPQALPVYIMLSLVCLFLAGEMRLKQLKEDNAPRPIHPLWVIVPVVILLLFMLFGAGPFYNMSILIIIYSSIPLIIAVILRLFAISLSVVPLPLHPFGIITPAGILLLFLLPGGYLANKIPSVSFSDTHKTLRTWPDIDNAEGDNWDPRVSILCRGEGNPDKVKFIWGWITISGFDGEPGTGTIDFRLDEMICSGKSEQRYILNVESLSELYLENALPVEDITPLAEETYQSMMEIKAAKSENDLDSTYAPMWSCAENWAIRLVGGIGVTIISLPFSFLLANRYLKKCKVLEQKDQ